MASIWSLMTQEIFTAIKICYFGVEKKKLFLLKTLWVIIIFNVSYVSRLIFPQTCATKVHLVQMSDSRKELVPKFASEIKSWCCKSSLLRKLPFSNLDTIWENGIFLL